MSNQLGTYKASYNRCTAATWPWGDSQTKFTEMTVQIEEKNSPLEEKETAETFSIEDILVSCPTDTFFLPLKLHDPNQKSIK